MRKVAEVQAREGYRIWVQFADGMEGEVDLSDLAGKGVFRSWEDRSAFEKMFVHPESETVAWPGGIDLCPDSLYEEVTGEPALDRQAPFA